MSPVTLLSAPRIAVMFMSTSRCTPHLVTKGDSKSVESVPGIPRRKGLHQMLPDDLILRVAR